MSAVLARYLSHEDWVTRYHAAKSYCRQPREFGSEGLPRLDEVLADEDEGVREAALQSLASLLPEVKFSDAGLVAQLDACIERGLADEDEDVRAAAEELAELRQRLIG